jgi:hypothetical protein
MTGQSKITKHIEQRRYEVSTGHDPDFRHPGQAHCITYLTHRLCRGLPRCEFVMERFPESRRKAYYPMSIQEHLLRPARREVKEVDGRKGLELAKVARRDRQHFDCAIWLHKAPEMPKG